MVANIFLFLFVSLFHPLHLSVSDIYHNPQTNSLEITQRIFIDDLEKALRQRYGRNVDIYNSEDPELLSEIIGDYVLQNFRLSLNARPVPLNYLGYEIEEDAVWVYLEAPKVRDFKNISVRNSLLFELFTDQLNLINVKKEGAIRSLKLEPDHEQDSLNY